MAVMTVTEALSLSTMSAYAAWTGTVNVSALNIRSSSSASSGIKGVLSKGATVNIKSQTGSWYEITATVNGNSIDGYVFSSYITAGGNNSSSSSGTGTTGTVNVSALNVRSGASTSASVISCISAGTQVTIQETLGDWHKVTVSVNGQTVTGYVFASYITKSSGSSSSAPSVPSGSGSASSEGTATGYVNVSALNVRSGAGTSYTRVGCLNQNTQVTITETVGEWYNITTGSVSGYVFASYITKTTSGGSSNSGTEGNNTGNSNSNTNSSQTRTGKVNTAVLNFRSGPGTNYDRIGYLYENNIVSILEETNGWYKISAASNGRVLTGYVSKEYITVTSAGGSTSGSGNSGNEGTGNEGSGSEDFEQMIAAFPESYKAALRNLHVQHPNWVFKAINTRLDWNTVVTEESVFRRNTIEISSFSNSTNFGQLSTASGAYDWATDKYTVCDGKTWYSASSELVKYYMDPRNFLDEKYIFTFESLAYDSAQKQSVVESILSNTFMKGNYTETDPSTGQSYTKSYAKTFMEAGKLAGASPYFLAGRSLTEVGNNGSNSTSGTYGSYKGYYNFYNIGAGDGADAVASGLRFAGKADETYLLPWNTRYKSIVGGAKYISQYYINVGQNTPYFQKFNVVNKSSLYWHQYMTAIHGATSQAATVYNSYKAYGVLDDALVFYIPVYSNMPASPCAKPSSGNPNPYLKSLTLNSGNAALTPSFKYDQTDYTVVVANSVSSINVSAAAVSSFAKGISGTGTYNLTAGQTTKIQVTCIAGNGAQKTYTINVFRAK